VIIRSYKFGLALAVLCVLASGCRSGQKISLFDATMRSVRMRHMLLDTQGNPIQFGSWTPKGEFMKMTETEWVPVDKGDRKEQWMMYRYLLIPNAPWMRIGEDGAFIVAQANGHAERIGEHDQWHPVNISGQKPMTIIMWKTTDTNGKWVGVVDDRIYESAEDGTASQIGWLKYKSLTLETGETVLLFMTKGMTPGAVWEGDVKDTLYRELAEGKGTPVAKLAYRPIKLEDGTESVLLMSRPLQGKAVWTGARNGKIIESADSN